MTKTEALNKSAQDAGFPKFEKTLFKHFEKNEVELENIIRRAMDIYVSKWISVEERLPEIGEAVLILTYYGKLDVCRLSHSGNDIWLNDLRPQHSNGGVTHWQPLPTAP